MAEGTWASDDRGLEAIIQRFTRPVNLVQQSTFVHPPDDLPDSEQIGQRLDVRRWTGVASTCALGLHFGGIEGVQNSAVQVGRVARIVRDHVPSVTAG